MSDPAEARREATEPLETAVRGMLERNGGPTSTPYGEFVFVERGDFEAVEKILQSEARREAVPPLDDLIFAVEELLMFVDAVEWTGTTVEAEAADLSHAVEIAIDKARSALSGVSRPSETP